MGWLCTERMHHIYPVWGSTTPTDKLLLLLLRFFTQSLLPCGRNSIELSWHGRLTCFIYLNTPLLPHRLILPRHEDGNEDDDYDYDKYYSVSLSLSLSLPMHPLTVTGSKQLPLGWYKCGAFVVLWSVDGMEQSEWMNGFCVDVMMLSALSLAPFYYYYLLTSRQSHPVVPVGILSQISYF